METVLHERIQVVGLGQACVDYLGPIRSYPPENSKEELVDIEYGFGGPASTAMITLSRLGIATSFMGSLADDAFGKGIIRNLLKENVDLSASKIQTGFSSQFAFIAIHRTSGTRTIFWHRGSAPHLMPEDIHLEMFPNARFLHLDGLMLEASMEAAKQARERGITVVMDGGTMREGTPELVSMVDILIASEPFSNSVAAPPSDKAKALSALAGMGPHSVAITLGSGGSIGRDGNGTYFQKAFDVSVKDTTGAGDVYHGAYIYGLIQGWNMPKCMEFASAASALNCRFIGAQAGIPDLETILGTIS